jgi:hypothetical protein
MKLLFEVEKLKKKHGWKEVLFEKIMQSDAIWFKEAIVINWKNEEFATKKQLLAFGFRNKWATNTGGLDTPSIPAEFREE